MLCRLFFFLVGLTLSSAADLRLQLPIGNNSPISGDPLIQTACKGVGEFEKECISTLQSAPADKKSDTTSLAFFTLKFVEDHAVNLTADIQKLKLSDYSPLLQSAFLNCLTQYNPLDDIIEVAVNAVVSNSYSDAQTFIAAAIDDVADCDSQLNASEVEDKLENIVGDELQLSKNLKEYNSFLKNMLSAASNILKAKQ